MHPVVFPQDRIIPVGVVLPYAGPLAATDPVDANGLQQIYANLAFTGWLYCDGSALYCAEYPLLYGVIGKAFGYSENSQDPKGPKFNLPDLRGRFVRGVDGGVGLDPSIDLRVEQNPGGNSGNQVGTIQPDAYQRHEHQYSAAESMTPITEGTEGVVSVYGSSLSTQNTIGQEPDQSADGTPRFGKETRPVNIYMNYIIRYL